MLARTAAPRRLACLLALSSIALSVPAASAAAASAGTRATFARPSSVAAAGRWVVVADKTTSTLSVLSATNGALEATVPHRVLGVSAPDSAVASTTSGRTLVIVAGTGGNVAELSVTASRGSSRPAVSRLRILRPSGCAKSAPAYLAVDAHGHVLEACATGVVTEWAIITGGLLRSFAPSVTKLTNATGIAVLGTSVLLTNAATSSASSAPSGVTELSLATGTRVRTVTDATNPAFGFDGPSGIATDGTNLWEINAVAGTLDELDGTTLALLASSSTNLSDPHVVLATKAAVFVSSSGAYSMVTQFTGSAGTLSSPWMMCNTNGPYKFAEPSGFAISGASLWVTNSSNGNIDRMKASTGALVATYG